MNTPFRVSVLITILVLPALTAVLVAQAPQQPDAEQPERPRDPEGRFTMALTGDSIITRRLSVYREPPFLRLIDLLRGADVAFTNLEMLFHDYESWPMHESGGTWMRGDPELVEDLVWAGFDMVSRANNHTGDYGVAAMRSTTRYVDEAGLVQAGVGESLAEAREATFLETAKGRVALISVASTFPDHSRAGRTRDDIPPRPGLNPLRFTTTYAVTRQQFEGLRDTLAALDERASADGDTLSVFGERFVVGQEPDVRTEPLAEDLEAIAAVVKSASRLADYVLVTMHAHEGDGDRFVPARFLVTFARAMIDAGADLFVGHGPHVLRGIEMYNGRPILYSLGDFIFQNETLLRLPSENYEAYDLGPDAQVADFNDARYDFEKRGFPAQREIWESVVAVPAWERDRLVSLELHPITLGFGQPPAVRGRPMLADGPLAEKILNDLIRVSKPFGTAIRVENGIGRVVLTEKVRGSRFEVRGSR